MSVLSLAVTMILSVFALMMLNGSTAWFTSSDEVEATGFTVMTDADFGVTATLKSYPVIGTDFETGAYPIYYETESYTLPTHDPNGISYSKFGKALAIIIQIEAESQYDLDFDITASTGLDHISEVNNMISNCISVSAAELSEDGSVAIKGDVAQSFVTVSEDGVEKKTTLALHDVIVPAGSSNVCFLIEYDMSLLGYISNEIYTKHPDEFYVNYSNDIVFTVSKCDCEHNFEDGEEHPTIN